MAILDNIESFLESNQSLILISILIFLIFCMGYFINEMEVYTAYEKVLAIVLCLFLMLMTVSCILTDFK